MKRTVLGLLLFLAVTFMLIGCGTNKSAGTVTIQIITEGDNPKTTDVVETEYVSNEKVVNYTTEDTLFTLVYDNFSVACQAKDGSSDDTCSYESQYGHYILKIDTLQVTKSNEYISFYVNGDYATAGIDSLALTDGAVYQFKLETF